MSDYYLHERTAVRLLTHYLRQASQKAGLVWDGDNNAEIAEIVDEIILAVFDRMKEREDGQNG